MSDYKKIIELINPKNGFYLDSCDLSKIISGLDDLIPDNKEYSLLFSDLELIRNASACEYGRDYGSDLNWDNYIIEMVEKFKEYTSDLIDLIEFLKHKYTSVVQR